MIKDDVPCKRPEAPLIKRAPYNRQIPQSFQSADTRILVVDDNEDMRELLEMFFDLHGYGVISARNGEEAWYLLQEENFDLVLTDICMPGQSGNDLARHIKDHWQTLPVIAVTGTSWLAEDTFDEIISKPVFLHALLDSIEMYLAKPSQT